METNSKVSEFHSGDLDPANTVQKERWSDGRDSAEEENSVQPPWVPPCNHDPEEDPAGLSRGLA